MRKLHREPLSEHATRILRNNTVAIVEAGDAQSSDSEKAKFKEAKRRWKQKPDATFDEIRKQLHEMAPGIERCMYCESNEGTDIDHFWPISVAPCRTFDWHNYLLACSACNSNHKRDRFPCQNGRPLLINPAEDEPVDHLALSPTGKYVAITEEGECSISVFGLDRGPLERTRKNAWSAVEGLIVLFANACKKADSERALQYQKALCEYPQASVFAAILRVSEYEAAADLLSSECLEALEAHPEIKTWLR